MSADETRQPAASKHSADSDHIVSHPGQCCNGYCVEELGIHGEPSKLVAEDAADTVQFYVKRAVSETLAPVVAVLDEYASLCSPGPYTSERALYERLRAAVTRTGQKPSGGGA